MRVVLDTNILVAGLRSSIGASRMILIAVGDGAVTPVCNVAMMLEYEEVLKREASLTATGMNATAIDTFLNALSALVEVAPRGYSHRPILPDSDDETFLEAAINAQAEGLITHNVSDFRDTAPHPVPHGVSILRPAEFLRRLPWRPSATTRSAFRFH